MTPKKRVLSVPAFGAWFRVLYCEPLQISQISIETMNITSLKIIPYERRYKRDLLRLTQSEDRLHVHLDWNSVEEWVNDPDMPIYLAWQDRRLVGAIGAAPALDNTTWMRLIAFSRDADIDLTLAALWDVLKLDLRRINVNQVAILLLWPWTKAHIEQLGFSYCV